MRVRLSVSAREGTCSQCGAGPVLCLPFTLIIDGPAIAGHAGEADKLCQECLFDLGGLTVEVPMTPLAGGPAPRRKALRKGRKASQEQERNIAFELGAHVQPNSGAMLGAKGDVRKKGELRVEAKYTAAESFSLKLQELWKIEAEAGSGEKPIFVIDYLEEGTRKLRDRYAVLPFDDYKELLNAAGNHR